MVVFNLEATLSRKKLEDLELEELLFCFLSFKNKAPLFPSCVA